LSSTSFQAHLLSLFSTRRDRPSSKKDEVMPSLALPHLSTVFLDVDY
jgi:hypothetical protein